MKALNEYQQYILCGGGAIAEHVYHQLENEPCRLAGVIDTLAPSQRKFTAFHGYPIQSPDNFAQQILDGRLAAVVCLDLWHMPEVVRILRERFGYPEESIFLDNPYTSCRPWAIDNELAADVRIPTDDVAYDQVRKLFHDEQSLKIFDFIRKSKTFDYWGDDFEIISYQEIKDLLWYGETYWEPKDFSNSNDGWATVLDCGAFIGDSIRPVCEAVQFKNINYYAFEPLPENARQIRKEDYKDVCTELTVLELGVSDEDREARFIVDDAHPESAMISSGYDTKRSKQVIHICKLDSAKIEIKGQLLIKMDIEGAELPALKGAKRLLREHRPALAICVYHRKNDIVNIPLYLKSVLPPDYDFVLRGGFHTIFCAIPRG